MSDEIKETGGPAFPLTIANNGTTDITAPDGLPIPPDHEAICFGMTLRDYFAAKAMQALFAGAEIVTIECAVPMAYRVADAMLAERNK